MAEGEAAAAVEVEAAGEEADASLVARIPRALRTPGVGRSAGDLFASSGTLKEASRTSERQRYPVPANVSTVYTEAV